MRQVQSRHHTATFGVQKEVQLKSLKGTLEEKPERVSCGDPVENVSQVTVGTLTPLMIF